MGWHREPFYSSIHPGKMHYYQWKDDQGRVRGCVSKEDYGPGDYLNKWFDPSTDHNAAALVRAKLVEWGYCMRTNEYGDDIGACKIIVQWYASVDSASQNKAEKCATGMSWPEAICKLAVLVARERKVSCARKSADSGK